MWQSVGMRIRSQDVNILIGHLHKYAYTWKEIGFALGFNYGELEYISISNPRATTPQLLTVLLIQWSQWPTAGHPDVPTMEKLCDALSSRKVELGEVVKDLYEQRKLMFSRRENAACECSCYATKII